MNFEIPHQENNQSAPEDITPHLSPDEMKVSAREERDRALQAPQWEKAGDQVSIEQQKAEEIIESFDQDIIDTFKQIMGTRKLTPEEVAQYREAEDNIARKNEERARERREGERKAA